MIVIYRRYVYLYNIKECRTENSQAPFLQQEMHAQETPRSLRVGVEWLCHSIWQRFVPRHHSLAHHLFYCRITPIRLTYFQSRYLYFILPLSKNLSRSDCRKYFVSSQRNPTWVEFSSPRCSACFLFLLPTDAADPK